MPESCSGKNFRKSQIPGNSPLTSLSFPPANFIATTSAVDGIEVYMPAPPESEKQREVIEFHCPQCGAGTAYSAADGALTCTHCGYYEPPRKPVVGKGAEEFEFTVETLERAAHGWGEVRKELQCQGCSAYTSVPPDMLTHSCPFCGSNKVIQRHAPQDVLRPRFMIPFKVENERCRQIVKEWLGSSWLTPAALRQAARTDNFSGVYLPFWTFDAVTRADWRAEVGHRKTERYYSGGKWQTRTRIVWRWENGHVKQVMDDLLIRGALHLSELHLGQIKKDYDLSALAPYEPKYLAGFQAQAYSVPLEAAWATARQQMREQTRLACHSQASTSRIRNFSMNLDFSDETWRYILLPAYLSTYTYDGRTFQVMINGQTGAISGQRPVAWLKVWLVVAGLLSPGAALGLVGLFYPSWSGLILAGFLLLAIAIGIGFYLVSQAMRLDDA
jgi:ribosomal protein S27AE